MAELVFLKKFEQYLTKDIQSNTLLNHDHVFVFLEKYKLCLVENIRSITLLKRSLINCDNS